jgi:hypothetical protein
MLAGAPAEYAVADRPGAQPPAPSAPESPASLESREVAVDEPELHEEVAAARRSIATKTHGFMVGPDSIGTVRRASGEGNP